MGITMSTLTIIYRTSHDPMEALPGVVAAGTSKDDDGVEEWLALGGFLAAAWASSASSDVSTTTVTLSINDMDSFRRQARSLA